MQRDDAAATRPAPGEPPQADLDPGGTDRAEADQAGAEQAEALSRAAREAVRQPPDPRLERTFAHLGLGRGSPAQPMARGRTDVTEAGVEARTGDGGGALTRDDLEPIVTALRALRLSTDGLRRHLLWVNVTISALTFAIVVVLLLVLFGSGARPGA